MSKKTKKLSREDIPDILDDIITLFHRGLQDMKAQESISTADMKELKDISSAINTIYKDYREELKTLQKDLNALSKTEIQRLAKQGVS